MAACRAVTIYREVIDDKTVASRIKTGNMTVHVKSIFSGSSQIDDLLFEIAKDRINNEKQHPL